MHGLLLLISTNQIIASSNQEGHMNKFLWSIFQMVDAKVLFDEGCVIVIGSVLRLKTWNIYNEKHWRTWKMVRIFLQFNQPDMDYQSFIFQSAPKFLDSHRERDNFQAHASLLLFLIPNFANVSHKDQWKYLKSVCVAVEFNGKDRSKNVAKHNMCLVSADISYF